MATESPAASRAARQVLEDGGNAIDAAAAATFAISVARPQSCGIGGGGFLVYRSASGATPTLDFREDGRPILVTGGAGGSRIIMGALETIINRIDFGLTLPQTVDAERFDTQGSSTLEIEDARVDPAALADLQARGWTLTRLGEYGVRPRIQLAGVEPRSGRKAAVSDSRSDRAALAQRTAAWRTTPLDAFCALNPGACRSRPVSP